MQNALRAVCLALLLPAAAAAGSPGLAELERLQSQFAPVDVSAEVSTLPANERAALAKLVRAAQVMDGLFLRQAWAGNETMLLGLLQDRAPVEKARLAYFLTEKGPWDRQDGNRVFVPGAPPKPEGSNFYPSDATKQEIETWIGGLPPSEKEAATGFFTVVRRTPRGLAAVPYSVEYENELRLAAGLLREAASLTGQPSLKDYLQKRAAAFLSNDYYDSDVAWMELDASIEPTIGPYETYEDDWFSYKAAFEAFVTLRDDAETARLKRFGAELQGLEDRLPIDPRYRNPVLGRLAPIRVVNEVFAAGDAAHGVTTAAFNLPNDERVTREKGSKRTMLKNIQQAKFKRVLLPLARLALTKADEGKLDFDAFFTHILMHELMHGLGPHEVYGSGGTPVRKALQDLSSALEEAKADIAGLWALQQLIDKGALDRRLERTMYATFLASGFRTLRFGATEAHGKGMALQLNYLLDKGGFVATADGRFGVDPSRIAAAVAALSHDIMDIQARGDYGAARALFEKFGSIRPSEQAVISRARDVPVDIAPRFRTAQALLGP